MDWIIRLFKNLFTKATKKFGNESLFVRRRIFYNYIVIAVCILISCILILNIAFVKNQSAEDPFVFIFLVVFLVGNSFLISHGFSFQILPSYSIIVFVSIFTYFSKLDAYNDIAVVSLFSFITMIWLFISFKWWHLLLHSINVSVAVTIRLKTIIEARDAGVVEANYFLHSINAYIFLIVTVLTCFLIYYIMNRELMLSNREAEHYKQRAKMFDEVVGILESSDMDSGNIKQSLDVYFDPMTGCLSRLAYINLFLSHANIRYENKGIEITYIDLDRLKFVNDNYGHSQGDAYLLTFVKVLKRSIPQHEGIYRIGGDEFVIITNGQTTYSLSELLNTANENLRQHFRVNNFAGRFSYGIASSDEVENGDVHKTEKLADQRMYLMKKKANLLDGE